MKSSLHSDGGSGQFARISNDSFGRLSDRSPSTAHPTGAERLESRPTLGTTVALEPRLSAHDGVSGGCGDCCKWLAVQWLTSCRSGWEGNADEKEPSGVTTM